jgi:hypothetical protein
MMRAVSSFGVVRAPAFAGAILILGEASEGAVEAPSECSSQERAQEDGLDARLAEEGADEPAVPVEVRGPPDLLLEVVGGEGGEQRVDLLVARA